MKKQKISDAVIHRLPRYYRYLDDLYNKGVVRISSSSLGDKMDITASQIRQDLSCFGEFGQQGYGYNVAELRAEIGHILGIDNGHRLIIIGVGHLGHALLQNFDFEKVGFQVDSAFDVSPALVDTQIRGVTIRPMDQLAEYVARYRPNVAVLTVPQNVAQPLADQLIDLGIRGFWNFTITDLKFAKAGKAEIEKSMATEKSNYIQNVALDAEVAIDLKGITLNTLAFDKEGYARFSKVNIPL